MNWINVKDKRPNTGYFDTIDVWVCCGYKTYSCVFIKDEEHSLGGRFYLSLNYPKRIFEDITEYVSHWLYVELPEND